MMRDGESSSRIWLACPAVDLANARAAATRGAPAREGVGLDERVEGSGRGEGKRLMAEREPGKGGG